jgi:hypothetical protein
MPFQRWCRIAVDWTFVIYIIIIVLIFPLILIFSLWRYRTIKRLMQSQAMKRNGTVVGTFLLPQLKFQYGDLPVLVTSVPGSRYQPAKTEVNITLSRIAPSPVTIYRESVSSRLGKYFGAPDMQLGSDEFDREYVIKAEDAPFVKNLLTTSMQNMLLDLKDQKPYIFLNATWLTIHFPKQLHSDEQYDQLINLATSIADRVRQL